MKNIATTPNGGQIVEFQREEYENFVLAVAAAQGKQLQDVWIQSGRPSTPISNDMTQFFIAMAAFVNSKFKINEMESLVSDLKLTLDIETPGQQSKGA